MKITLLFFLLFVGNCGYAQEQILRIKDIEQNERKVIKAFEKYQKKPKKKRLKERFTTQYNESVSNYLSQLNILSKASQLQDKNWEGIVNALKSLQYLNVMAKSSKSNSFISTKDYSSKIDSVSKLAVESLYRKGKQNLEKEETIYSSQIAYDYLKRVLQFDANYLNTKELIDLTIVKGTKTIFFAPVKYDNLGNFIEWGTDNSSMSSDYIIKSLVNDLSINNIGSHFVNNSINADWIVEIKWVSLNMSPERNNKYTIERSTKIKVDGKEQTVYATVNYYERFKDVSGELICKIKDAKTQDYILIHNFTGASFFSNVEATYTGDDRALTYEDNEVINSTNSAIFFTTEGYELTTKMYSDAIHQQILENLGRLLNWNYNNGLN